MKYKDWYWLNKDSVDYLEKGYLSDGETPQDRVRSIADEAEKYLGVKGFSDKFYNYMAKGWISLSSPVWSNFGSGRGLSISCNSSYIPDSVSGIMAKVSEIAMMTKNGAGTSGFLGDVRPRGSKISVGGEADGPVRFLEIIDKVTNVISQGGVRRGSFAAYLPVEHPDILEFLDIREEHHAIQKMSIGVCISDAFMEKLNDEDSKESEIWVRIMEKKRSSGYPYIFWSDTVNNTAPKVYKDKGMRIHNGNLCNEICLSSSESESYVCCLSSVNLLHYDEWKDTDLVETLTYFLDAVMEDYIQKTENMPFMEAPHLFAKNQRAIGLGVLGWHSYLQSKMIAFESFESKMLNSEIFKFINEKSLKASKELAELLGEPPLLKGYGERMVTRLAIAPTTSSSFVLGQVSPSIEPLRDNYFVKGLAKGDYSFKNPFLKKLLIEKGQNTREVWKSILQHGGSVQHLEFLSSEEKAVFKTFGEINPREIIIQASIRQKSIDQGQSLNLLFGIDTPVSEISDLYREAWSLGVKGLYYERGANPSQEVARNIQNCTSCEA